MVRVCTKEPRMYFSGKDHGTHIRVSGSLCPNNLAWGGHPDGWLRFRVTAQRVAKPYESSHSQDGCQSGMRVSAGHSPGKPKSWTETNTKRGTLASAAASISCMLDVPHILNTIAGAHQSRRRARLRLGSGWQVVFTVQWIYESHGHSVRKCFLHCDRWSMKEMYTIRPEQYDGERWAGLKVSLAMLLPERRFSDVGDVHLYMKSLLPNAPSVEMTPTAPRKLSFHVSGLNTSPCGSDPPHTASQNSRTHACEGLA